MTATLHSARNTAGGEIELLPLRHILPSALNPRKHFDADALTQLADSIREHGLLQPIVVRPVPAEQVGFPHSYAESGV